MYGCENPRKSFTAGTSGRSQSLASLLTGWSSCYPRTLQHEPVPAADAPFAATLSSSADRPVAKTLWRRLVNYGRGTMSTVAPLHGLGPLSTGSRLVCAVSAIDSTSKNNFSPSDPRESARRSRGLQAMKVSTILKDTPSHEEGEFMQLLL